MTEQEKKEQQLKEELENLMIKTRCIQQAFTVEDDFPEIKRTYTYRGNKF